MDVEAHLQERGQLVLWRSATSHPWKTLQLGPLYDAGAEAHWGRGGACAHVAGAGGAEWGGASLARPRPCSRGLQRALLAGCLAAGGLGSLTEGCVFALAWSWKRGPSCWTGPRRPVAGLESWYWSCRLCCCSCYRLKLCRAWRVMIGSGPAKMSVTSTLVDKCTPERCPGFRS